MVELGVSAWPFRRAPMPASLMPALQLPDRLVFDAGRVELVRAGGVWTIVKGLKPNPRRLHLP